MDHFSTCMEGGGGVGPSSSSSFYRGRWCNCFKSDEKEEEEGGRGQRPGGRTEEEGKQWHRKKHAV